MANRIRGITVEIGGDTTKLQTALKGVNYEIKNTQSQFKAVEQNIRLTSVGIYGTNLNEAHNAELWDRILAHIFDTRSVPFQRFV